MDLTLADLSLPLGKDVIWFKYRDNGACFNNDNYNITWAQFLNLIIVFYFIYMWGAS